MCKCYLHELRALESKDICYFTDVLNFILGVDETVK
jgi:hypothetical protein